MTQVTPPPRLETPPEEAFDRLTRLAARLLGAPVALVSVIGGDRVFLESAVGMPEPWASHRTMPLAYSFCRHVVASGEPLVVEDARRHPLVRSNPAIRELSWISYAGVPLITGEGRAAGTLCVIDALPRLWSPRDVALLQDLAASVVSEMALRSPRLRGDPAAPPPGASPPAQVVRDPAALVFEISALPMGLVDGDGRWLRVNHALAELLGSTPGALAGCPAEASTHPADRSADAEATRLLLAGECASYTAEKRLLRDGDEPAWVLATVTALPPEPGLRPRYHVAFQDIGDRKRAEQDLRLRVERYRLAAAATQDAVWDWDLLTDRIVWDETSGGSLGYQSSTLGGGTAAWWYERLHADDRERIVSGIHAAIACGATEWSDDCRFRTADGRYVRGRAAIVRDEAGDAVRMVGALTDVTGQARADLLAHGQSRLLEQIAVGLDLDPMLERVVRFTETHGSDLLAAVMVLDPETRMLRLAAGPSLPAELRAALDSVPVHDGAGLSAAAAARRERVVVTDLAGDPTTAAWRGPLLAEGIVAAWAMPLFATDGALLGTLQVHYAEPRAPDDGDLHVAEVAGHLAEIAIERARTDRALARSNRLLEQVLDTLPIGVWVLDGDGLIRFANPGGRAIWGAARFLGIGDLGELRGWRAATGDPIAPEEWAAVRALRAGETSLNEVVHIATGDGVHRTLLNSAAPLRALDGEIIGAIALYQDITEQRARAEALGRSEEQLRHAQKMEAVGLLAGGIAHDFNNLLTGILSYSDLVLQELRHDDPIRGDVEQIREAGQRAAGLTRQLLAFSRRQVLQPRVISLNSCVTEVDAMLRRLLGADVTLESDLDPGLWPVLADPVQLEQVLVNLVVNARDAMPDGGRVTIATANLDLAAAGDARGNELGPGAYITLSVSDTGLGMDVPTQARIFEPFFTTKEAGRGTGLGLSTVYGIVEQSGGHIVVESAPGQGSTFTVFLPRHVGSAAMPAGQPDRRSLPGGTETVLLVEDEAAVRSSARRLLERYGYNVIEARHGVDALRIVEEGSRPVDLVITDLWMPEMGGRELVRRLRARYPEAKVLFMSGSSQRSVSPDEEMPPGTGFVEKPFTVDQLIRRTREILDG